jgi:hypothetical protein
MVSEIRTFAFCPLKHSYANGLIFNSSWATLRRARPANYVARHPSEVISVTPAAEQGLDGLATGEHSQAAVDKGAAIGLRLEEATNDGQADLRFS